MPTSREIPRTSHTYLQHPFELSPPCGGRRGGVVEAVTSGVIVGRRRRGGRGRGGRGGRQLWRRRRARRVWGRRRRCLTAAVRNAADDTPWHVGALLGYQHAGIILLAAVSHPSPEAGALAPVVFPPAALVAAVVFQARERCANLSVIGDVVHWLVGAKHARRVGRVRRRRRPTRGQRRGRGGRPIRRWRRRSSSTGLHADEGSARGHRRPRSRVGLNVVRPFRMCQRFSTPPLLSALLE